MIVILIVACEVGFWVAVLAGLLARYPLRRPRLGAALLIAAPAIDVMLLILVAVDLLRGGTASWQHGLAAIYIGFSVAFGHQVISWADVRFAHRFASGPPPVRLSGTAYTIACWKDMLRTIVMVVIAGGVTWGLIALARDGNGADDLLVNVRILGIILAADVIWAVSYTIWPRRASSAPPVGAH
ncbi:hypothetical protein [uncultured Microbacterium sp.]|uniref:hypothetical protein n=1 Tax=uncultured Microbacterium sp. TaxID=191216 RepID=UPI0025FCB529|nr:hypothetical protein [uncultured Microbacterium sp.]